eukprot:CAMPEP_0201716024 /NCGR_PEP_ID=MMETSP0593-20130828/2088_1 /ASSEMBLY_ACC=CAM_ASM_000672 /TAXON_ID=267983 /ORGANISM="Skeletonema japonicum, Strain CCMP2506" /LENGTH=543 /DNA_ID=CAMNT_0048205701 /DNA_START=219 /DNA_END=1850 /DNA_ORIENTATION=-
MMLRVLNYPNPKPAIWQCFNTVGAHKHQRRQLSSLPHHLARHNNGMVNILVKSTKVPRPLPKTFNQLKKPIKEEDAAPQQHVPSHLSYAGSKRMPITSEMRVMKPGEDTPSGIWPVFRIMDESGSFRQPDNSRHTNVSKIIPSKHHDLLQLQSALTIQYPHFKHHLMSSRLFQSSKNPYPDMPLKKEVQEEESDAKNTLLRAHRQMHRLRQMDTILHNAQRQGRISFYMTQHGEEAIHMGSASALSPQDVIFAQYREAGLLMWRGFTLEQFCNQCFSNDYDLGKGRQMPIHYGSRALNYQTVSSPLGTQITQAVGAAYKFKLDAMNNKEKKEAAISIVYFGEGAASTTDFHSACNFAATLGTPMIFFCRNNGYAISTPAEDQYAGDGIISRAPGYGMAGIRVDGNDVFAVHAAVAAARKLAIESSMPVMIEAMTYRQGHHSTSDDSSRYRDVDEVQAAQDVTDPILRMDKFLCHYGWMDDDAVTSIRDEERTAVLRAMEAAEARPKPKLDTMFTDVYQEKPPHLIRQESELRQHLKRHNITYH